MLSKPQNYIALHNPTIMLLLKNNKKDAEKKCGVLPNLKGWLEPGINPFYLNFNN